jgi:hypothetical protein
MIPRSGKTASKPLQVAPAQVDSDVTAEVSPAPVIILPAKSSFDNTAPTSTQCFAQLRQPQLTAGVRSGALVCLNRASFVG